MKIVICLALLNIFSVSIVKAETIISKKDADHMFSMKKSEWEEFKFKYVLPDGWEAKFVEFDTGSSIMAFDKKKQYWFVCPTALRRYKFSTRYSDSWELL